MVVINQIYIIYVLKGLSYLRASGISPKGNSPKSVILSLENWNLELLFNTEGAIIYLANPLSKPIDDENFLLRWVNLILLLNI